MVPGDLLIRMTVAACNRTWLKYIADLVSAA